MTTRKIGAVTFFFQSMEPRFWFYPSDSIQKSIDEIERIGKVLYQQINNFAVFQQEFLQNARIEEAVTSAIYEGAHSTRAQAQQLIASGDRPKNKSEWMLYNNVKAMNWVKENLDKKLSSSVILQLHKIVTANALEGDDINFSGQYRNDTVHIGPHEGIKYTNIESAIEEMIELTTNSRRYLHPLIKCILVHYFIAYIHPFFDGNGRTARALFYFKALRNELSYVELLSVSAYLKDHGKQYEKSFEKVVGNDYDMTYFITFCLDSMLSALNEVSRKVSSLLQMADLKRRFGISDHQVGLLQRMALNKFRAVSIEEYAAQIHKSREFSRQDLKQLKSIGLLDEVKSGKKFVYRVNVKKLKEFYHDKTAK